MSNIKDSDLQACLSVQPKRAYPAFSKTTKELVSELLCMVDNDSAKAMAIIAEIMHYNAERSIDWYYERAIAKLSRQRYQPAVDNHNIHIPNDRCRSFD